MYYLFCCCVGFRGRQGCSDWGLSVAERIRASHSSWPRQGRWYNHIPVLIITMVIIQHHHVPCSLPTVPLILMMRC